ncbi:InlB B-repeat-containing protein [Paenibacillus sinopodophylli]|uniref:InlB B-repeat-containing protein n=1 Tax=Paenibacillus sinopodophylli TaxID=1837342 RepID=UPI00110D0909|nr:InlB B-repeat-containing protein [Paenibacillus sinopodophylli]
MIRRGISLFTVLLIVMGLFPSYSSAGSGVTSLTTLTLSSGKAVEDLMDTWKFYADVANNVSEITVTPTAADADSKIEVNGVEVASGSPSGAIALNVGVNTIEILVTPAPPYSALKKITTLTVTRAGGPGSNTILNFLGLFLESEIPGDLPVGFGFNKSRPFYDLISFIGQNKVLIDPQPEDSGATVTVNGIKATRGVKVPVDLLMGDNTITVVVTASDGTTTRTYTLLINRLPGADTSLIELGLNNGIPVVDPGDNKKYSVNFAYGVKSTRVYPVAKMDYATITVNGKSVANGGLSEAIPLEVGSNTIAVVVTSENGLATANYTLTVTRGAAPAGYKVTFVENNGGVDPVADLDEVSPGSTIARPEVTHDGYLFAGWYKEGTYNTLWDFDTDTVNENTTLYAKWTPTYSVVFDSQGGSLVERASGLLSGATVPKPSDPTRAGYAFSGWYVDENFSSEWNFATDTEILNAGSVNRTLYAKWTAVPVSTYTVTFDSKEGSAVASLTGIAAGATITKPTDPTRAGYTFSGWYKDEGYASAWNFSTDTVSANTILYAKWTAIPAATYTVTFNSQGGSSVASLTGIASGVTITKPTDPTRAGYTFSGWYKDEGYASAWNFSTDTVSANTTLYAKWTAVPVSTYTVTFDSKEGSAVANETGILSGATIAKPTDPTRAGYTFSGWYEDEGYASAWNFTTDTISANTTLYAKWTAIPASTYTVTFDSKEGSAVASLTGIAAGATITKPMNPTRAGYTFSGWYKDEGYASVWNFTTDSISANATLYAKWTAIPIVTYTVTFDSKEGSAVASLTGIAAGATVTKPSDPTRAGYTFSGWYKDEGYASAWNFLTDTVSANTTLYAKWTAVPVSTYTVTFDSKEGSAVASLTGIASGVTITKPSDPTRAGYTFSGWYKDEGYASAWNFSTDRVSVNTTLYAKWTAVPVSTYTVTFDSKEGSAVANETGILSGATVTKPTDPTRAGYTFSGWYKDEGYASAWNFTTDTISANTTLYAKWTKVPSDSVSGGGVSVPDNGPVISNNGELTLPVGRPGTVSLSDDEITIEIPVGATDASLRVTVETLLDTDELLKNNEVLVSEVFEVLKNVPGTFKKNITLKLAFDPTKLGDGERASIFYFDEEKKEWVEVGGVVSGGFITAEVNHFTKFAVLAVGDKAKPVIEFIDITGHWAEEAIRQGASQGITTGYPDGTFKPNFTVTRAQFAVMLMNAFKLAGAMEELAFKDASQIPAWAKNAVAKAKQAGIINGYDDGTFRPNAEITRVEMAAMIVKALDLTVEANAVTSFADNSEIPAWAKGAVAALKETGLMQGKGDNRFDSEAKASRAEAVTVLLRMLEQQKTKE